MIEPLTTQAPVVGTTVALVLTALTLFAMLALPALRVPALFMGLVRLLRRALPTLLRKPVLSADPTRPPAVGGLSAPLVRLTRATRTTALELRRCSTEASDWPAEAAPRVGWRESLLGGPAGRSPLMELRSEVFEWLRVAETLPPAERQTLVDLGIQIDAVRKVLTEDMAQGPAHEGVRALAGLMWEIDERLASASTVGYRASGGEQAAVIPISGPRPAPAPEPDSDERTQRTRWSGTLAEHGRGLSRMAGTYTRSAAEREDLEQDIALALWRALPTFRGESSLKTFAYKVARYCCFRHVRRRTDLENPADPATVADPGACIESAILHADQRIRIEQALTDLPGNLESVLSLHLTGHSYAQIAETLGITERNVGVRLSRARARLRRQLVAA